MAGFIKKIWKPRGTFRLTRVNRQSFKIGFYSEEDFKRMKSIKWDHLREDLIIVRRWNPRESVAEDVLDSVPQKAIIHNIPAAMWGDEAVSRISSSLGKPIEARVASTRQPFLPPPLETCVIIGKYFDYPPNIRIRTEGCEGEPGRDMYSCQRRLRAESSILLQVRGVRILAPTMSGSGE